ncbi:MAG: arginine--tRNA ligase [bacterium]
MRETIIDLLNNSVNNLLERILPSYTAEDFQINLEPTKNKEHGDLYSNIAFTLSKKLKRNPFDVANEIISNINFKSEFINKVKVEPPGFINFFFSDLYWQGILDSIINKANKYGHCSIGQGKKVLIEFVSANPTGPLHIGHGRCAAFGDTLANLLKMAGYNVFKEYYINDAGRQIKLLAKSIFSRYKQILNIQSELPEDGYHGEYIKDIAFEIYKEHGNSFLSFSHEEIVNVFSQIASKKIIKNICNDLKIFRVNFDNWFRESYLYEKGEVNTALSILQEKGFIYEKDGAKWMKAALLGDQKDRVIIRSNGEPTYFASDIAYHKNKYERDYKKIIDIWGADHHGYMGRIKAVLRALNYEEKSFSVLLVQMVKLIRNGIQVNMSTRKGTFTSLEDVLNEVGPDAARFFFLLRRHDSHLEFDLDLAKKKSAENPVYYCQYAYARICSIERKAKSEGIPIADFKADSSFLKLEEEKELIKKLHIYPYIIINSAQALEPHRITFYLIELSTLFHKYYNAYRIISDDQMITLARIKLIRAIKIVINSCLSLLGVFAPEKM